jgi:hypothetical protein
LGGYAADGEEEGHDVNVLDKCCLILAGLSLAMTGAGFLYVFGMLLISKEGPPEPPRILFAGVLGTLSSAMIYAGAHLLKGDLFK